MHISAIESSFLKMRVLIKTPYAYRWKLSPYEYIKLTEYNQSIVQHLRTVRTVRTVRVAQYAQQQQQKQQTTASSQPVCPQGTHTSDGSFSGSVYDPDSSAAEVKGQKQPQAQFINL